MGVAGFNDVHCPSAVISARFGFVAPAAGLPPIAVRYTWVALVHEYSPTILKFPSASAVTVFVSKGVAVVAMPLVLTLYSWIDAFATGLSPPTTCPLFPEVTLAIVLTGRDATHPEIEKQGIIAAANMIDRVFTGRPYIAAIDQRLG
jgi:hypothetical protein